MSGGHLDESDVRAVAEAAALLPPPAGVYLETDFVTNVVVTVVDFQMHTTAVERAMQHFAAEVRPMVHTLDDLDALLTSLSDDKAGNTALAQHLWGYDLWTRAEMLRGLCAFFRSVDVTDQERLREWAHTSSFKTDFQGRVRGLGPAVYNWLVMRQGVETVKPDVHVHRFTESALGRRVSDDEIVTIVTAAASTLGLKAYELDWRIWEASRTGLNSPSPSTPEEHASSSTVQQRVEDLIISAASAHLGVPLRPDRVPLPGGSYVEVDGVSDDHRAFVEAFARQGAPKGGQVHKLQGDALKLALLGRAFPDARLAIAVADSVVGKRLAGGWLGEALRTFGIEIIVAEIPDHVRNELLSIQTRQVMVNVDRA